MSSYIIAVDLNLESTYVSWAYLNNTETPTQTRPDTFRLQFPSIVSYPDGDRLQYKWGLEVQNEDGHGDASVIDVMRLVWKEDISKDDKKTLKQRKFLKENNISCEQAIADYISSVWAKVKENIIAKRGERDFGQSLNKLVFPVRRSADRDILKKAASPADLPDPEFQDAARAALIYMMAHGVKGCV